MPDRAFHAQGVKQICKMAESRISMAGFVTQYYPVNSSNSGSSTVGKQIEKPNQGASAAEQIFYFELCTLLDSYQWFFVKGLGLEIYDIEDEVFSRETCCDRCRPHPYYYQCCCCSRRSWIVDVGKVNRYPSYFIEVLVCQLSYRLAQALGSVSTINATLGERTRALSRAKTADARKCPCPHLYYSYRHYGH
jgi:hypothetical protein